MTGPAIKQNCYCDPAFISRHWERVNTRPNDRLASFSIALLLNSPLAFTGHRPTAISALQCNIMQRHSVVKQLYVFPATDVRPRNRRKSIFARAVLFAAHINLFVGFLNEPSDNNFPNSGSYRATLGKLPMFHCFFLFNRVRRSSFNESYFCRLSIREKAEADRNGVNVTIESPTVPSFGSIGRTVFHGRGKGRILVTNMELLSRFPNAFLELLNPLFFLIPAPLKVPLVLVHCPRSERFPVREDLFNRGRVDGSPFTANQTTIKIGLDANSLIANAARKLSP